MSRKAALTLVINDDRSRVRRDRLELMTALLQAPDFDPLYLPDIVHIPPDHPVYPWRCTVPACERTRRQGCGFCHLHHEEWTAAQSTGTSRADFVRTARPLKALEGLPVASCRICPDRPADRRWLGLCKRHCEQWRLARQAGDTDFERWIAAAAPQPGFGTCIAAVCPDLASSRFGLCDLHLDRYRRQGRPGGARSLRLAPLQEGDICSSVMEFDDEALFRKWCRDAEPVLRLGAVNLSGLSPLIKAEIKWGLHRHARMKNRSTWPIGSIQRLVNLCHREHLTSLADYAAAGCQGLSRKRFDSHIRMMSLEIAEGLRCIYFSPSDSRDAGFIETEHFGRRFSATSSYVDLTRISQRWLRDLFWDHLADLLRSPKCPRSRGPIDNIRRAGIELSAFLEIDAPDGGHDPRLLHIEHGQRFVADQRHRERHGLDSLGIARMDGQPSRVSGITRAAVFNYARKVLVTALESGVAEKIGLDATFVLAIPYGGSPNQPTRNPFSDEAARALAEETNLQQFAATYDPNDRGLCDVWETIVYTGRRCKEVITLRVDCIGHYGTLPMLWHDQTKVGNYNEGIRIPEYLYQRLDDRRRKTLRRFEDRHGRPPTAQERANMALFPSDVRSPHEERPISYTHFSRCFRDWVDSLDLGPLVPHQARHTLATRLLSAGATLAHIRRFLGHLSERMAEHYVKVSHSDLDDYLSTVWVAGPGSANPGEVLSGGTPLSRQQALGLAMDLSRRSTPTEGGICTHQLVVDGGACPWKLNCEGCDKFVLSGADLLYWRRKQEQWGSIAERAPDDATADYLHTVFEPTARAIAGLERALAGAGLLEQALALDLRRPQDYFQRVWSLNFRVADLASLEPDETVGAAAE